MLKVENLIVNYGAIKAIRGLSLNVPEKSIITLIGANGAGKSTTLRAISSIIKSAEGSKITYEDKDITNIPPQNVQMGLPGS
jgi:branched-chain amino acid transport system ATP-binding protein